MSHKVVIGGFGSGERQMQRITEKLSTYYNEDVEGFSLRQAMDDPARLTRRLKGNTAVSHSAGLEAMRHTYPAEIIAIAPALPTLWLALVGRAGMSSLELVRGQMALHDLSNEVWGCMNETISEMIRSPHGHLKYVGRIARSDAFEIGLAARRAGITTSLAFMEDDKYFHPQPDKIQQARALGVRALTLPGCHEGFAYDPVQTMKEYHRTLDEYDS